ncbi:MULTISPECIES: hypothetical protein [Rhizobium/Agrobacterium group]|uniref:Uncharacterized protein n=1 Tax=Allorhizobium ampelinum (strain ATCC BAA-846 / DSM 112012 / S4) TaxID=311402 RepID=B9K2U1_ALLAM|nr:MULTISPECIES: hypothetical protein [Rhizobium/Agrobacterium group]ACM39189.1 hypothetical protein Avi_6210 [Allorhizobium ampelinum S4]MUO27176.1 hypothetical protein [Agrobacterium vitis]
MQWYHAVIGIMAALSLIASQPVPRAMRWVLLIAACYAIPVLYMHAEKPTGIWFPMPSAVSFLCDAVLVLAIHKGHKERWEFALLILYMVSATCGLIQTFGTLVGVPSPLPVYLYGGILEAVNAVAFALIGGIGMVEMLGHVGSHFTGRHGGNLARVVHVARSPTPAPKRRWKW